MSDRLHLGYDTKQQLADAARLAERARIRAIVIEVTTAPEHFWLGEAILDRIDGSHDVQQVTK